MATREVKQYNKKAIAEDPILNLYWHGYTCSEIQKRLGIDADDVREHICQFWKTDKPVEY